MLLPSITKKIVTIALLSCFLLIISPVSTLAVGDSSTSSINSTNPPTTSQSNSIVPIPSPSSENSQITPIPTTSQNYQIQQALDLGDIGSFFKNLGGGIANFAGCMHHLFGSDGCLAATAGNIIELGGVILQHLFIKQGGGQAVDDAIAAASTGNMADVQKFIQKYQNDPNPADGGLLGVAGSGLNTLLAIPLPVSGGQYFASINPFKSAAASTGEQELANSGIVLEIWKKVRDACLALAVVALIIIGFMIMFRIPINPRTVTTIQNSLPRIVIALLLIFFSFAIAGLMVDATKIISSMMHSFLPSFSFAQGGLALTTMLAGILIAGFMFVGTATAVGGPAGTAVAEIILVLLALLLIIIMLVLTFTLIYKLVYRFVLFLLLTMFAPVFFLVGALPKTEGVIFTWFKRVAACLLAIPAVSFVLNLAVAIGLSGFGQFDLDFANFAKGFPGGMMADWSLKFFGWAFAAPVIGLVLFSFAVKVPDIIDELFGIKGLGARVGGGGAIAGAVVGAPAAGFMQAGNIGRAWRGTEQMREGAGRVARGLWGSRPEAIKTAMPVIGPKGEILPVGTEITATAEPRGGGLRATIGRGLTRAGWNIGLRPRGQEAPAPWKPIIKTPDQSKRKAEEEKIAAREAFRAEGQRKED